MLYEMNKEAHIVIETPVGIIYSITVHETTIWSKIVQCGNREDSWHKRRNINTHHPRAYYRSTSVCY